MSDETAAPRPPEAYRPCIDTIPDELKRGKRFVNWRFDLRQGKWSKPPYTPSGSAASVTDAQTWSTFAEVSNAVSMGLFPGLGIVLDGTGLIAFDLDKCRNPATGAIHDLA